MFDGNTSDRIRSQMRALYDMPVPDRPFRDRPNPMRVPSPESVYHFEDQAVSFVPVGKKLNKENVLALAEYLEHKVRPEELNMTRWSHCVAGHCYRMMHPGTDDSYVTAHAHSFAIHWLGLSYEQQLRVFSASNPCGDIGIRYAVRELRAMAASA